MNKLKIVIVLVAVVVGLSGCGEGPEEQEPPYNLTGVEITPEEPTFADTVRIEAIGEPNPYSSEPRGEETIDSYTWHLTSTPYYSTDVNDTEYVNEEQIDTVEGRVWGRFKPERSPHFPTTGTVTFEIIYQTNGEEDE